MVGATNRPKITVPPRGAARTGWGGGGGGAANLANVNVVGRVSVKFHVNMFLTGRGGGGGRQGALI